MQIEQLLSKSFCDVYHIDLEKEYEIEFVDAIDLLVPERIDIIAKYKYVECYDKGYDIDFIRNLYVKHIEAFSLGKFTEPGNPNKVCLQDYLNIFHELINTIRETGINPDISVIPVGRNNIILNGAHRASIALYYGLKVPIVRLEHLYNDFGLVFFEKRQLDQKYLDFMMQEYIKLNSNLYIACLYPAASGREKLNKAIKVMKQRTNILYKKDIPITTDGLRNFMIQIYKSDMNPWIGSYENRYAGVYDKLKVCTGKEDLRIFILDCESLEDIRIVKKEIRAIYEIGNSSIHITDTKEEAVSLANIVFNANSIHCLNYGKPDYFIKFNRKLNVFRNRIEDHMLSLDEFIIDSSSVMGLYALRDIRDIDFLSVSSKYHLIENNSINCHHSYVSYYHTTIDNLLMNPENYLVYHDTKFITLEVCKRFKSNRDERKDRDDVKLINTILNKDSNKLFKQYLITSRRIKRNIYYAYLLSLHIVIQKGKGLILIALKKLGFRR